MKRLHFTKASIEATPVPTSGAISYQDTTVSGLYLRISATGARTWSVFKWNRVLRRPQRVSLGPFPSIGVDLARRKAGEVVAAIDQGRDLAAEKRQHFAVPTLGELSAEYAQRLKSIGRRHPNYLHDMIRLSYADWLNRRINTLTQREISKRHDEVALNRGNVAASRYVKGLRTLFRYAEVDLGLSVKNVARSIRVQDSKPRGRYLSPAEEQKLLTVLGAESPLVQDYIKLLLLTGARRDNVAGMRWADVNMSEATWTIPASSAKAGTAIKVPLVREAMELLKRRLLSCGSAIYCFPSRGHTGRLIEVWYMLRRIKARAVLLDLGMDWRTDEPLALLATVDDETARGKGFADLTIHDLRRTVAVKLVSAGASLPVIAAAMGHKNLKTTQQVYALATQDDVRAAMERMINASR